MGELARRVVVDLDAVLEGELVDAAPGVPVRAPLVVVDAPPPHRIENSPLWGRTRLGGRVVTDPVEVAEIAARIARYKRRRAQWWRRPW